MKNADELITELASDYARRRGWVFYERERKKKDDQKAVTAETPKNVVRVTENVTVTKSVTKTTLLRDGDGKKTQ